jgi:hypothetical protein
VLGLASSITRGTFRGWCLKITPEGKAIPVWRLQSRGVGPNAEGVMFCVESGSVERGLFAEASRREDS